MNEYYSRGGERNEAAKYTRLRGKRNNRKVSYIVGGQPERSTVVFREGEKRGWQVDEKGAGRGIGKENTTRMRGKKGGEAIKAASRRKKNRL